MKESLSKAIEIFLSKYFISTIISFVLAVIVRLILPDNNLVINKIGTYIFDLFIFCISFLLIEWAKYFYVNWKCSKKSEECEKERHQKNLKKFRTVADEMYPWERNLILKAIKTKNKIIDTSKDRTIDVYNSFISMYFHKTMKQNGDYLLKLKDEYYEVYSEIYKKHGMLGHFKD